jgi:NADH:ubiquinone oxidoreductase subunit F (NADH-binding)
MSATAPVERPPARPSPGARLPRLFAGITAEGALTLEEHIAIHGPLPDLLTGAGRRGRETPGTLLIHEIQRAGLLGRGGAGFPLAAKLRAVAERRRRGIVVVNASEGEPASLKDRTLLEALPHLVLDGALLAAQAIGSDEVIVCVCETAREAHAAARAAIAERAPLERRSPRVALRTVPAHYVAGQESALISYLGGGPALPGFTPPMPFEQGLRRRPTLVSNAETLAHVSLIARHGADWFRQIGTAEQPGSALVTLSGPVASPGVYEIEYGASLASLIAAAGGTTRHVRGALLGGYAGSWVPGDRLDSLLLSSEHLGPLGAALGAGIVLLLSDAACPVAETARAARWLASQSAGQCGPCVFGLDALAGSVEDVLRGGAPAAPIGRLTGLIARRGACGHPDGAVNLVVSALRAFAEEFDDHARHGPCERCTRAAELPLPRRPVDRTPGRAAAGARR